MTSVPTEEEVLAYFESLSNAGRWGEDDELGTLNFITPARRVTAAGLVQEGFTVSCGWDIPGSGGHAFGPPQRYMIATGQGLADERRIVPPGREGDRAAGAAEYLGLVYHGYTVTHLDALSHIFWDGKMYNGKPAEWVTAHAGATHHAITAAGHGIVTRGVLLDVASLRGVDWLEPGDAVVPDELEAAEAQQGVRVGEGDVLLLRTGYARKVRERGHDDVAAVGRAGWHASCLPWFHSRGVAVIGCDTAQDAIPSGYEKLRNPIHAVGITAMGLWLLDNCDLEPLASTCEGLGRWEFMFTLAPLRWTGATGSPANPLATF